MATKDESAVSPVKRLYKKLKSNGKLEITVYVILAAVVVTLFLAGGQGNGNKSAGEKLAVDTSTETERRLNAILLSMKGVGAVESMISFSETGEVTGVIVIADGAQDMDTRLRLRDAVKTVLNVDSQKVEVFEMKNLETED